jgi:uncharacterized protein (TIRG00374 family)
MNVEMQAPVSQPGDRGKQIVKQLILLALAGALLWLAFRNTNFSELWREVQKVNMAWLVALSAVCVVSHVIRAWRWTILLRPLAEKPVGLWNAFCAVMYGYAVNIAVPRGGEVARIVSIAKTEKLPWIGVVPTMFIDRLLDIAMLVLLIGITLVLLPPEFRNSMQWMVPAGVALCVATVLGLGLLPFVGRILKKILVHPIVHSRLPDKVRLKLTELADEFDRGTGALRNPVSGRVISSVCIWGYLHLTCFRKLICRRR